MIGAHRSLKVTDPYATLTNLWQSLTRPVLSAVSLAPAREPPRASEKCAEGALTHLHCHESIAIEVMELAGKA